MVAEDNHLYFAYKSPLGSVSLSSFSSSLRFFSFSLSSLLWSFAINILEYCSEFLSLFAFIRISLAFSSFPCLTSTGLVLFSSLFPSLINCFCSTCSTPISLQILFCMLLHLLYIFLLPLRFLILVGYRLPRFSFFVLSPFVPLSHRFFQSSFHLPLSLF